MNNKYRGLKIKDMLINPTSRVGDIISTKTTQGYLLGMISSSEDKVVHLSILIDHVYSGEEGYLQAAEDMRPSVEKEWEVVCGEIKNE